MAIRTLKAEGFRNLSNVNIEISEGVNVFVGSNAAGKSSLLEAVGILSRGKSFRGAKPSDLIQSHHKRFTIVGLVERANLTHTIGIQRSTTSFDVRVDGLNVSRSSQLSEIFPTLIFEPRSVDLVSGAPDLRRRLFDWGCFHHDSRFLGAWQRYLRAMRQRNALLRITASTHSDLEMQHWEKEMDKEAVELDGIREDYLKEVRKHLADVAALLGLNELWEILYARGWQEGATLAWSLGKQRERDRKFGFTRSGPQRMDLDFKSLRDGRSARLGSRGQQRSLAFAVMLAQMTAFREQNGVSPTLLLDDLGSELDDERTPRFVQVLGQLPVQVLLTSARMKGAFESGLAVRRMFHVEQGEVTEVI